MSPQATMAGTAAFMTSPHQGYEKDVSDLGQTSDDDTLDESLFATHHATTTRRPLFDEESVPQPAASTDNDTEEDGEEEKEAEYLLENDDDDGTGYRMSVEVHLQDNKDGGSGAGNENSAFDFLEEETTSTRSWRSPRSWRRGRTKSATSVTGSLPPHSSLPTFDDIPRVEVYVDISADSPMPRPSSASAIRSNNNINPPTRAGVDLGSLLATVPSDPISPLTPDALSVQSQAVFSRDDFEQSYWLSALTTNSGYLGLAVIAVTISFAHPLLFMAAAFTALGTATAVGASYDCFVEVAPCCTASHKDILVEDETIVKEEEEEEEVMPIVPTEPSVLSATPTVDTDVPQSHVELPSNWLNQHFPVLDYPILTRQKLEGLNVVQFFDVFFSDSAPYCFREFQVRRGDKNVEYGKWGPVQDISSLSMHPLALAVPTEIEPRMWVERELHFNAKTNNSLLGPPYATTTKRQRCLILSKKMAVLEMKTTLADIPFCDRFYVLERWVLTAEKDAVGVYHLQMTSRASIIFDKSCPFESQIKTKTRKSLGDVGKAWYHMAQKALELAKEARLNRLHQQDQVVEDGYEIDDDAVLNSSSIPTQTEPSAVPKEHNCRPSSDENVEVMHCMKRRTSWVMGEEGRTMLLLPRDEQNDNEDDLLAVQEGQGKARTHSFRRMLSLRQRTESSLMLGGTPRRSSKRRLVKKGSAEF